MSKKYIGAGKARWATAARSPRTALGLTVVALLLTSGPTPDANEDDIGSVARYAGEELYYSLELYGNEMARGAIVMGQLEETENGPMLPVSGLAFTEGLAAMIFPMRDGGDALIDPTTGLTRTTLKDLDERDEQRSYGVEFFQSDYRAEVTRVRQGVTNRYERILPSNTHDGFSWMFAIRDQNLTPGSTEVYFVFDGWKLSRVTVTVAPDEERILVGDEYISCRRLSLTREVLDSTRPMPMIQESANLPPAFWVQHTPSGDQRGDIYISNDERRLPVQAMFANNLISIVARLTHYRPPSAGY